MVPIIKSIIFSAIPARNIKILPPGRLGLLSIRITRRRPNKMFLRKSNIPPNSPLAGAASFLTSPLPFLSPGIFSSKFSCFFRFAFSSPFLSSLAAAFC